MSAGIRLTTHPLPHAARPVALLERHRAPATATRRPARPPPTRRPVPSSSSGSLSRSMACHVAGPTIPSTLRSSQRWTRHTSAAVCGPYSPSATSGVVAGRGQGRLHRRDRPTAGAACEDRPSRRRHHAHLRRSGRDLIGARGPLHGCPGRSKAVTAAFPALRCIPKFAVAGSGADDPRDAGDGPGVRLGTSGASRLSLEGHAWILFARNRRSGHVRLPVRAVPGRRSDAQRACIGADAPVGAPNAIRSAGGNRAGPTPSRAPPRRSSRHA